MAFLGVREQVANFHGIMVRESAAKDHGTNGRIPGTR